VERLKRRVALLAEIERDSAGPGERAAAELIASWMEQAGAREVRVEPFRYQGTYAIAHALHALAGFFAPLPALVSLELEASGRSQWLRRLLPKGEGANVVGRVGEGRRKVVLVAHHDAARTGLVWRFPPPTPGLEQPLAAALVLAAFKPTRRIGRALLALTILLQVDIARSRTVPGANDNATGVAAMLELAHEPPPDTELILVSTGCEESGMGGMRAFLDSHSLDGVDLVLGLDTLGSGRPVLAEAEGTILPHRYAEAPEGIERRRIGGWTDPILARFRGLRAASLLSVDEQGRYSNYHLMSDTPDNVDWASVQACLDAARRIIR
jgi:acetylornithine deacetylase/succinyl-diaminopimelate desuccinylase-like protein